MKTAIKDWYTISELAAGIGMSRKTVWAWIQLGKLKSERYGAQHRIHKSDWQRFLDACNSTSKTHETRNDFQNDCIHDRKTAKARISQSQHC